MNKIKEWTRKGDKHEIHHRSKYADHSRRFLEWVNSLGFEQTIPGQILKWVDERLNLRRVAFMGVYCIMLSSLIFSEIDFTYNVRQGSVAATDIKSPVNLELIDQVATEEKRREAEATVPPVFDFDPNAYEHVYDNVYRAFLQMRRLARSTVWPTSPHQLEEAVKDFMVNQAAFEKELGHEVPSRLYEWLVEKRFSARLENVLIRTLAKWSALHLVENVGVHLREANQEVIVREVKGGGGTSEEFTLRREDLQEMSAIRNFDLNEVRGADSLQQKDQRNTLILAQLLLKPNLTFNLKETDERRRKARDGVLPVQRRIQKSQIIVSEGQIIQPIHMAIINEIEDLNSARSSGLVAFAAALLFLTLALVLLSYLRRFSPSRRSVPNKDLLAMGAVTVLITLITKVFVLLADQTIVMKLGGGAIPQSAMLYLAPVAAGPMLVGMLIVSGEVVWLFTVFLATVLATMLEMNFGFLLVTMIGGVAAGRGVFGCNQRGGIYRAGIRVGLVNALVIFLVTLLQHLNDPELLRALIWNVPAGFVAGLLAAVLTMGFVPMLETWFNYTTDLKLLELASLNHPLMKEMIVKAPGTYHHSLVVGSMCEAAAEEIGANPLLAKVMAYYHDIGKIEHAQYFIENQRPGHNPHDHISPNMSKTVLIAHVKDGAEMGYAHRLGKPIIDGILQHHGTTLISFFYNKALEGQDVDIHQVNEEDFRYPGPKPQFREAALVMLADSIEAAARSLEDPTAGRLQNIVKNVIQNKFLDGQLEECNLTLKDLTVIEAAYKRVLLGVYHQRVDYPMKYSATRPALKPKGERRGTSGA
ncbi:MAG: HD family phosphohydrolase [Bdellovibrionales bacterium]